MNAVLEIDCRQNDTALHKRYSTTSSGLNVTDQCREMTSASEIFEIIGKRVS